MTSPRWGLPGGCMPSKVSPVSGSTHRPQVLLDESGPSVCTGSPGVGRQHIRGCLQLRVHAEARDACPTGQGP